MEESFTVEERSVGGNEQQSLDNSVNDPLVEFIDNVPAQKVINQEFLVQLQNISMSVARLEAVLLKVNVDHTNELQVVSDQLSFNQTSLETKVSTIESKLQTVQLMQNLISTNIDLSNKLNNVVNPTEVKKNGSEISPTWPGFQKDDSFPQPAPLPSEVIPTRNQYPESVQDSKQRDSAWTTIHQSRANFVHVKTATNIPVISGGSIGRRDERRLRDSFGGFDPVTPPAAGTSFQRNSRLSATGGDTDALHQAAQAFRLNPSASPTSLRPKEFLLSLNYDRYTTWTTGKEEDSMVFLGPQTETTVLFSRAEIATVVRNVLALEILLRRFHNIRPLKLIDLVAFELQPAVLVAYNECFNSDFSQAEIEHRFQAYSPWEDPSISVAALIRCLLHIIPYSDNETSIITDAIAATPLFRQSIQFTWHVVARSFEHFVRIVDCYVALGLVLFPNLFTVVKPQKFSL